MLAVVGVFALPAWSVEQNVPGGWEDGLLAALHLLLALQFICDEALIYCSFTTFLSLFLQALSLAVVLSCLMFYFTYIQYLHVIFNVYKQTYWWHCNKM